MPRRRRTRGVIVRRRPTYHRQRGGNIFKKLWGFAKKANKFLRRSKLISKGARLLDDVGVPYAGRVGRIAGTVGYGRRRVVRRRRRRRRGGGIGLAGGRRGGSLRLAGGQKKRLGIMY